MKNVVRGLILSIFVLSLVIPSATAFAAEPNSVERDDKIVYGGTFTVEEGEVFTGNIVVLGGVVTVEEGAFVDGDIVVLGGNVNIAGEIDNNLVAIGGVVNLTETVVIHGDMIAPASVVHREDGAVIDGQIITDTGFLNIDIPSIASPPDIGDLSVSPAQQVFAPVVEMLWLMFQTFFISAVAVFMSLFFSDHLSRTRNAISIEPVIAGGLGLFTYVVLIVLIVFLALLSVFIITIPFTVLGIVVLLFAFVAAGFMGWVALGMELGERIQGVFKQNWSPALQSGIGTFMLTFLVGSFGIIFWDFLGGLFLFAVSSIGIGAVTLTRFGTRLYVPSIDEGGDASQEDHDETAISASLNDADGK